MGAPLTFQAAQQYRVNRRGEYEVTRQSLYDFQSGVFGFVGPNQFRFFAEPAGQGGKTKADTNMELASQLAAPKYFLIESLEVMVLPDPTISARAPIVLSVADPARDDSVQPTFADTVDKIFNGAQGTSPPNVPSPGTLELHIGSKTYTFDTPLQRFPPKTRLATSHAFALQNKKLAGAKIARGIGANYAVAIGDPYDLRAYKLLLAPTQNFQVTLTWPNYPTNFPAAANNYRIGVILDGAMFRLSQ